MEIQEIKVKDIWDNFLLDCQEKTFLNSWNWGEFNKMMGNKIWRWGIYEKNELVSVSLVLKIEAKRGKFLLVPHGPVEKTKISDKRTKILAILLEKLKEIGRMEKVDFIRVSPIWERNKENVEIFKMLGFREAPIHIHPEITWELDIRPEEKDLLSQMRKTTRYLIRKWQKNSEIKIYQSSELNDIEIFNQIYLQLAKRHHFVPFSLDYLKNEFLAFLPDHEVSLFLGEYKNEILAGGMFIFWQGIGFYHHGASSQKYPKIPISYLLLWEAIREAKRRKCQRFNFWGIAPISNDQSSLIKKHPWYGLTLFKMGFGGYRKEYVRTQDFPLSKKYWLNFFVEKLRKTKRGL